MSKKVLKTMDGNEAAAYISYAFTEVATIYPITPSSPMAEHVDVWSAQGKKNLFNQTVRLVEMQSEAGAAGAMHGSLETGALTTTYTASQGLMLMIPPLYRLSGQLWPGVLHVSARSVGTHAFSIFGEHSDVMACRQAGLAMLCSSTVQEVMDLAGVAHLSAIKGSVPFMHFFDGFRTSHEIQKIEVMDYDDLGRMLDYGAVDAFRKRSLNPERPVLRSTVQNPDVYFQSREAANPFYNAIPGIVEEYMHKVNAITGRNYQLFNYYGAPDAERVIVVLGSSAGVVEETCQYLNAKGEKVGLLQVHLYRPFSVKHFLGALPETVKKITVLDRTKEPGSLGEPLYLDVCAAFNETTKDPKIYAGRYGLSIKDFTANQVLAVFANMQAVDPKNHFTVGIDDDVTFTSLSVGVSVNVAPASLVNCKFWGLGSDGTVGANKNSIKIIGDHTDMFAQAYFEYDSKKSGGLTRSHLRFGSEPIIGSYLVTEADFVACHNQAYIDLYDMVQECKPGGTFLLNTIWDATELDAHLPGKVKRYIAANNINFYTINAVAIGKEIGLGNRTNAVLQSAFFKLSNIIPIAEAVDYMKKAIVKSYSNKGEKVLNMNFAAVDQGIEKLVKVAVPASWKDAKDTAVTETKELPAFVRNLMQPINSLKGDLLPVSAFKGMEDGTMPLGTTQYEKRGVAVDVPEWDSSKCLQCNQCAYACPHAAIRPFLFNEAEAAKAPAAMTLVEAKGGKTMAGLQYRMQVDTLDCMGCGVCVNVCPVQGKALVMKPLASQGAEVANWEYALSLVPKDNPLGKNTIKGSQFEQPLLEFSGACAGCGETPYMKLLTQLYGDRLIVANATGCTQAWGGAMPSIPYTTNKDGHGPAWSNSLFENNAEFALGMYLSTAQQRERLAQQLEELCQFSTNKTLKEAYATWIATYDNGEANQQATKDLLTVLKAAEIVDAGLLLKTNILRNQENLSKKSVWMFGGDGWAYDIGYGGLDHVLASGADVNVLIVDTEVYSNTGGQSSKSTPIGAVAQFAYSGKKTKKKDLGLLAMSYGYVYVASVAMGANPTQLLKALQEAEAYHGPSVVIAYAPCINHGLVKGMGTSQEEMKLAVQSGYWNLYRFNPDLQKEGKNPFILDSKNITMDLKDFLMREVRYASLYRTFPEFAEKFTEEAIAGVQERFTKYQSLAGGEK